MPQFSFIFLFITQFVINCHRNLFWTQMCICLNTINLAIISISCCQNVISRACSFIKKESSLNLILSFLVTRRCLFITYIPSMIVNISSIASSIGCLRLGFGKSFICKTLLYHKLFMFIL